jgi:NADH-quinone oxidoreductase subunit L
MITEALIVLLAPLVAFTIVIFFGKRLPRGGDWVSLAAIFLGLFISIHLFIRMLTIGDPGFAETWQINWFLFGDHQFKVGINLDNIAIMMLMVVTVVSSLVHLFSTGYMKGDVRYSRFFAFLSFFSFSMLGLVLADNLLIIFCFWELVGVSSYLLIGFWYEKKSASDAAVKAFVVNRIGDAGMLVGLMLVLTYLGTLNLNEVIAAVGRGEMTGVLLTVTGLCLFCGAVGKSAQFPLHVWLPDAMEGPTPVSALIHAATMVAAGVYLTARIFPILTPEAGQVIAYVGGFTALFAATIAVAQNDIKRVLAYSTLSQLGYMVMARRRSLCGGVLPFVHARDVQSRPVLGLRKRYPRYAPRFAQDPFRRRSAGYAQYGWLEKIHAHNLLDVPPGDRCSVGSSFYLRVSVQGRYLGGHPGVCAVESRQLAVARFRLRCRHPDRFLYVPPDLLDFPQ